jgi:hypothetical protein
MIFVFSFHTLPFQIIFATQLMIYNYKFQLLCITVQSMYSYVRLPSVRRTISARSSPYRAGLFRTKGRKENGQKVKKKIWSWIFNMCYAMARQIYPLNSGRERERHIQGNKYGTTILSACLPTKKKHNIRHKVFQNIFQRISSS